MQRENLLWIKAKQRKRGTILLTSLNRVACLKRKDLGVSKFRLSAALSSQMLLLNSSVSGLSVSPAGGSGVSYFHKLLLYS